jgi:hypothetical protein
VLRIILKREAIKHRSRPAPIIQRYLLSSIAIAIRVSSNRDAFHFFERDLVAGPVVKPLTCVNVAE